MMRILSTLLGWWWRWRNRNYVPPKPHTPWADPEHDIVGDLDAAWEKAFRAEREGTWTDEQGRRWKRFADGQVGEDISDLDQSNVEELRRIYGPAGIIPDAKLQQWAREAAMDKQRLRDIDQRLEQIEASPLPEIVDDGYRPAGGPDAGTSPKHGIVYPPKVTDPGLTEWVNLTLERAYGPGKAAMPAGMGYSMRYLNQLKIKAERRSASAYELSILRSRGLV